MAHGKVSSMNLDVILYEVTRKETYIFVIIDIILLHLRSARVGNKWHLFCTVKFHFKNSVLHIAKSKGRQRKINFII